MATGTISRTQANVQWGWLSPATGIGFAILFVLGIMARGVQPEYTASADAFASFYADQGNRTQMIIGSYMLILAAIAFLWFITSIYSRLRALNQEGSGLPTLMYASGLLFVGISLVAAIIFGQVPGSMSFGGAPYPGVEFAIQMEQMGFALLLLPGLIAAALCLTALSLAARRTGMLPGWLTTAGLIAAVILLFGPLFIPAIVLPLWVLVAAIVLMRRDETVRREARAQ